MPSPSRIAGATLPRPNHLCCNSVGPDEGARGLLHKSIFVPKEETTLDAGIDGV